MLNPFGLKVALTLVIGAGLFFAAYVPIINRIYRRHRLPVVTQSDRQAIANEREADRRRREQLNTLVVIRGGK